MRQRGALRALPWIQSRQASVKVVESDGRRRQGPPGQGVKGDRENLAVGVPGVGRQGALMLVAAGCLLQGAARLAQLQLGQPKRRPDEGALVAALSQPLQ
jgi:hypothetical protein